MKLIELIMLLLVAASVVSTVLVLWLAVAVLRMGWGFAGLLAGIAVLYYSHAYLKLSNGAYGGRWYKG